MAPPELLNLALPGWSAHCRVTGPPTAPALVLIHGLGNDLHLWDAQARHWAARYRVVCYDVFGHGQSSAHWNEALTLQALAQGLLDVMDALQLRQGTVIGTSMGAVIALAAAQLQPARFRQLVLCGARLHTEASAVVDVQARAELALRTGLEPIAQRMLNRWFPAASLPVAPQVLEHIRSRFLHTSAAGYASCAKAMASYDLRAALAQLSMPMLLCSGALDEEIPSLMRHYAGLNAGAQLHVFEQLGHLPNRHDAQAFTQVVDAFLR